jgi:hypothetical protein
MKVLFLAATILSALLSLQTTEAGVLRTQMENARILSDGLQRSMERSANSSEILAADSKYGVGQKEWAVGDIRNQTEWQQSATEQLANVSMSIAETQQYVAWLKNSKGAEEYCRIGTELYRGSRQDCADRSFEGRVEESGCCHPAQGRTHQEIRMIIQIIAMQ